MDSFDNNEKEIFDIINNHAREVENAKLEKEATDAYCLAVERSVQESIKREDRKIQFQRELQENNKKMIKRKRRIATALVLATTMLIPTAVIGGKATIDYYKTQIKTEIACAKAQNKAEEQLALANLAWYDYETANKTGNSPFTVLDNSTQDYMKIYVDDITDVYTYSCILPDEEMEDFIKSVRNTTSDGTYYTSYEDFSTSNGFSSEKEFEACCRQLILQEYENALKNDNSAVKGGK